MRILRTARDPTRKRAYRIPYSITIRSGSLNILRAIMCCGLKFREWMGLKSKKWKKKDTKVREHYNRTFALDLFVIKFTLLQIVRCINKTQQNNWRSISSIIKVILSNEFSANYVPYMGWWWWYRKLNHFYFRSSKFQLF